MVKETKYFMTGTDEEVLLGDVISQVLTKDFKDGRKITRNVEFKITENTLPLALELGIIEEGETEEDESNKDILDFSEDNDTECPYDEVIQDIIENQEELEKKVDELEDKVEAQDGMINKMMKDLNNCLEQIRKAIKEEKTESSKKK